jgi:hypothetical protein
VTVRDLLEHASGCPARLVDSAAATRASSSTRSARCRSSTRRARVDLQRSRVHPAGISRRRSRRRARGCSIGSAGSVRLPPSRTCGRRQPASGVRDRDAAC